MLAFAPPAEAMPALSPIEANAFQELGRELSDRLKKTTAKNDGASTPAEVGVEPAVRPATAPRITAMPPAICMKDGPFSTACRSAFWSTGSTR